MAGDGTRLERTWDGLPVASDAPHGAMIVVRRPGVAGGAEYLMLHRAHHGPDYQGDWAWTPPSGARLPGEPVLAGALRELAEESGFTLPSLAPVDVSGMWAITTAMASPDAAVRLDAEHDRFAWLSLAEALRRCQPAAPAANLRRAAAVTVRQIAFRPLTRDDLPDLVAWQRAPHAAAWFPDRLDLAAAERKYGPRIDGAVPVAGHIMLADGMACGFMQHYDTTDFPASHAATGGLDAVGIDVLVGVGGLTGQGLGAQVIWAYLQQVVFPRRPAVPFVVASPEVANVRSVRVLRKAGFIKGQPIAGSQDGRPEVVCVLDRARVFG